jgi:pimeloyl-ACP methyl ester carboxylesterase
MQMSTRCVIAIFLSWVIAPTVFAQNATNSTAPQSELYRQLKALPGVVDVKETRGQAFKEAYEVTFQQPLDHTHPDQNKFTQRVFVGHAGYDRPVLLETEGYSARGLSGGEMQRILDGNQVVVEHRFFGKSTPSPVQWEYMTVKQAADDMHAVVSALKTLYPGKWVSSGTSKGGQTALFFKCYYPDDVAATVAYVAPLNVAQEDPRIYQFLQTTGDEATRTKIKEFQIALLKHEDEILPLVKAEADRKNETFKMGLPAAFEYGVLEYPYAFWQYGTKPSDVPAADAPVEKLVEHYNRVNTLHYYSDQGKKQFEPFLYEAFSEIGYYNYDITDFKAYLKALKDPSNLVICPDGAKIVYNPATMAFVYHFLQYQANHVIYIYGDLDAWSATQMQLIGRTDAFKIVVKDSHHGARVGAFSPEQKELFYSNLERWLDQKVVRP